MARKSALQIRKERIALYKGLFKSPKGKEVLHDLLARNFVLQSTYSSKDPQQVIYNEGKRAVVLEILAMLEMDISMFDKLQQEALDAAKKYEV